MSCLIFRIQRSFLNFLIAWQLFLRSHALLRVNIEKACPSDIALISSYGTLKFFFEFVFFDAHVEASDLAFRVLFEL